MNKKFFMGFLSMLGVLLLAGAVMFFVFGNEDSPLRRITDKFSSLPERTNFVIFGLDGGDRTDVIMVCSYERNAGELSVLSVPRDTYVVMPKNRRDTLESEGKWVPSDGSMKINAVTHYSQLLTENNKNAIPFAILQVKELLGIDIDFYALFDLEAFKFVVEEIGGVTFDVPQRMYYSDPEQGLYIDLQPGVQMLNGSDAEGLVRFRYGYAGGDVARVEVQRDFIKVLISQALEKDNINNNLQTFFETINKYVKTDFTVSDLMKYNELITKFNSENMIGYTLPGTTKSISGTSYFVADDDAVKTLMQESFTGKSKATKANENRESSESIVILNGSQTSGLAKEFQDKLNDFGFNVVEIGNYDGEKTDYTRIIVKEKGIGENLLQHFNDAVLTVDDTFNSNGDIVIIIGVGEK